MSWTLFKKFGPTQETLSTLMFQAGYGPVGGTDDVAVGIKYAMSPSFFRLDYVFGDVWRGFKIKSDGWSRFG